MKRFLLLFAIMVVILTGCSRQDVLGESKSLDSVPEVRRFEVMDGYYSVGMDRYYIVIDTQTDNVYLRYYGEGALCPLYNKDGNIIKRDELYANH